MSRYNEEPTWGECGGPANAAIDDRNNKLNFRNFTHKKVWKRSTKFKGRTPRAIKLSVYYSQTSHEKSIFNSYSSGKLYL